MNHILVLTALTLFPLSGLFSSETDSIPRPVIRPPRISGPIRLTGKLDDPQWRLATEVDLRYEIQPGENTPAPQRTEVFILYNYENLYFGFRCHDTRPEEIRAHITDRDKFWGDDFVDVKLDTYGDHQRAYEFLVNPFGIQSDIMTTSMNEDDSFDAIWYSAAAINDSGWTAEIALPFKSLRFSSAEVQEWTLLLFRVYPRASNVNISLAPHDRNVPNNLTEGARLVGLRDIESSGSVELLPYAMGQQTGALVDERDPSLGFRDNKIQGRVGGGIRYSPNPNFSVDAVINPDFSQIETDADQISVNTTFALFYPEKRPFFVVGQELLQTPMYYSRSINNPLGAARVVGKTGSLSYLYLGALDRNTPFVIPGEEESDVVSSSLKSFSNIGRLRYDFGKQAYLGAMLTTRNLSGGHNYLAGLDWNYPFWSNFYFQGELFLTDTRELNDTELLSSHRRFGNTGYDAAFNGERYMGKGIHIVLMRSARDYSFMFETNHFSPAYRPDCGYFPNNDYREFTLWQGYSFYPKDSFIDRANIQVSSEMKYNFDWLKKEQVVQPGICVQMKGQLHLDASYFLVNDEMFRGTWFRQVNRASFSFNAEPWGYLGFSVNGQIGKFIYRSSSPSMGSGHQIGSQITLKPTSQLRFELSYNRARLSSFDTGALLYDGYITRGILLYQFTPEMFLRTITQYNSFGKTLKVYPLFSYKLNPFTIFYAGVTNDFADFDGYERFQTTQRQLFVKLQYLVMR